MWFPLLSLRFSGMREREENQHDVDFPRGEIRAVGRFWLVGSRRFFVYFFLFLRISTKRRGLRELSIVSFLLLTIVSTSKALYITLLHENVFGRDDHGWEKENDVFNFLSLVFSFFLVCIY